jgi:6-phosphogluconolactonase
MRETGELRFVQREPTHGRHPRNFNIDPTGRLMIVGNANTDNATFYRIDEATGRLSYTEKETKLPKPICVRFVEAD